MLAAIGAFVLAGITGFLVYEDVRDRRWFDACFFTIVTVIAAGVGLFLLRVAELSALMEAGR